MPLNKLRLHWLKYGGKFLLSNLIASMFFFFGVIPPHGSAHAEPITLAILGDSLVQGYGLNPADGFVPQLETWLIDHDLQVTLINAGVSGDTSAGGLNRVDWTLRPEVDGLVISLGGNDALRGIGPASIRENLEGILAAASAKNVPVLLVGITPPGNFGHAYKEQFGSIFPGLAGKHDVLLYASFLHALESLPDRNVTLTTYFQADAIHPNADGVALIVQDMGPQVETLIKQISEAR